MDGARRAHRRVDFPHPRHEHKNISRFPRVHDSLDGVRRLFRHRPLIMMTQIADFHRKALPFRNEDWTWARGGGSPLWLASFPALPLSTLHLRSWSLDAQILGHRLGLKRGRHHDHL